MGSSLKSLRVLFTSSRIISIELCSALFKRSGSVLNLTCNLFTLSSIKIRLIKCISTLQSFTRYFLPFTFLFFALITQQVWHRNLVWSSFSTTRVLQSDRKQNMQRCIPKASEFCNSKVCSCKMQSAQSNSLSVDVMCHAQSRKLQMLSTVCKQLVRTNQNIKRTVRLLVSATLTSEAIYIYWTSWVKSVGDS